MASPAVQVSTVAAVSVTVLGGALARVCIEIAKQKFGVDLTAFQADIAMLSGAFLGYGSNHLHRVGSWAVSKVGGGS
jgi:hypothetical protein